MDWIDAKEKSPSHYEKVVVVQKNGKTAFGFVGPKCDKLRLELYEVYEGEVVKWKPIGSDNHPRTNPTNNFNKEKK